MKNEDFLGYTHAGIAVRNFVKGNHYVLPTQLVFTLQNMTCRPLLVENCSRIIHMENNLHKKVPFYGGQLIRAWLVYFHKR